MTNINEGNINAVMDMAVKVKPMIEEYTTISESVKSRDTKKTPTNYFVTKGQGINKEMDKRDPDWKNLKNTVQKMINSELKDRMLLEAQKVGLEYGTGDKKLLVENFLEIGKS